MTPFHFGRLTLGFGLALALATLVSGLLVFTVAERKMTAEVDAWLAGDAALLARKGPASTPADVLQAIGEWHRGHSFSEKGHVVFDAVGRIVFPGRIAMARPPIGYSDVSFRDGIRQRSGRALTVPLAGGTLVVIAHSEIATVAAEMLLPTVGAAVAAAGLAGLAGSCFFGWEIARRTARVQATADRIARDDLSHRVPVDRLDGMFAEQAVSLNRMLDRMEDMVNSQRQFASHLAHDLRTPLTRLQALLGQCLDASRADRVALVERAERECASLIATFDALLRLSEIEAGRRPSARTTLDLTSIIEDVAETMEPVFADAGHRLAIGSLVPAAVVADNALLLQLFVNLLENIVVHAPAGTTALLSVARDVGANEAVVTVADDGPGLDPDVRQRAAEPFIRGAGTDGRKGHGLGLAIVHAVAKFHGGRIELGDAGPGLRVDLRLPLAFA